MQNRGIKRRCAAPFDARTLHSRMTLRRKRRREAGEFQSPNRSKGNAVTFGGICKRLGLCVTPTFDHINAALRRDQIHVEPAVQARSRKRVLKGVDASWWRRGVKKTTVLASLISKGWRKHRLGQRVPNPSGHLFSDHLAYRTGLPDRQQGHDPNGDGAEPHCPNS